MKAKDVCILAFCTASLALVATYVMTGWVVCRPTNPVPTVLEPAQPTQLRVIAEFRLHGQDCVAIEVFRGHQFITTFVDCGQGLVPSNPLPPAGDATTMHDTWSTWD